MPEFPCTDTQGHHHPPGRAINQIIHHMTDIKLVFSTSFSLAFTYTQNTYTHTLMNFLLINESKIKVGKNKAIKYKE